MINLHSFFQLIRTKGEIKNKPGISKNKKIKGLLFSGDVYALIDDGTFSPGNWFDSIPG